MTKKLLALLLTGVMALSCPVMTMAEATEVTEEEAEIITLDYSMIDPEVYEGTWITAFGVFDLFLPNDWEILVNAEGDEVPENDVYFQAANTEQDISVAISYTQAEGMDLEALADTLAESGFDTVQYAVINEIPVVAYTVLEDGVITSGFATIGDQGGMYNVTIGYPEEVEEDYIPVARNIVCSFSATEYAEEAAE